MRIEVNVEKKYFFGLLIIGLVLIGIVGVVAYNLDVTGTSGNPSAFGHSVDEMDWSKTIPKNVSAVGFCMNGNCKTDWSQVGGGTNASTIVTNVNSIWNQSGNNISYTGGNVGIGTSSPGSKLTVVGVVESTSGGFKFPDGSMQTRGPPSCSNGHWIVAGQGPDYYGPRIIRSATDPAENCRTYPSGSGDWRDSRDPFTCSATAGVNVNQSCIDVLDWNYATNGPGLNYREVYCKPYIYGWTCSP